MRILTCAMLSAALLLALSPGGALAHVDVAPKDSPAGTTQRYAIRVPSEKPVPTNRLEVEFPSGLRVNELEAVSGWRIGVQKDGAGRVVSAVWEGGIIPAGQFFEFGVLARNPVAATELAWRAIQTYQDGSEVQWIGPQGAEFPAAITRVQAGGVGLGAAEIMAGSSLIVALVAAVAAGLAWRRTTRPSPTASPQ